MRFNDVQDTRKKENMSTKRNDSLTGFAGLWARLFDENRERRMATVSGVTFTV
ncbi:MAG: hypothetical protein K6D90_05930 [Lachnospiraceae bacterium]|nr:hypothetical protein [Lachnospiraceae bacterium]